MSMEPDPPTRPIQPTGPPREPMLEREVPVTDPVLEDSVHSLRTWLIITTVVALAALAVALWAVVTKEEEEDAQRGATVEQIEELEQRVDTLESQMGNRATNNDVQEVADAQDQLREDVQAAQRQANDGGDNQELQDSVDQLQQSVDDMAADVDQLQQRMDDVERRQDEQEAQPAP
jgi:FtsZ-interacting cell division protein ZipA